eukprot:1188779-Prorocentrum_minimum.AAC.2
MIYFCIVHLLSYAPKLQFKLRLHKSIPQPPVCSQPNGKYSCARSEGCQVKYRKRDTTDNAAHGVHGTLQGLQGEPFKGCQRKTVAVHHQCGWGEFMERG